MTSPIRILDTGLKPAAWNVAMTAALAKRRADGAAPDTVRFHRYRECVLLGSNQSLAGSVDLEHCRHRGIEIAHRVTGGGAVYMSPRMLAWDVVIDRRSLASHLDTATRRICEGVAAGLSLLGCSALYRTANDIEIGGLKVSGSSGYVEGSCIALQGTILIEDDVSEIGLALRIPETVLRRRVTCLAAALGVAPSLVQVRTCVEQGLMTALDRTPVHAAPSLGDLADTAALLHEGSAAQRELAGGDNVRTAGGTA